MLSKTAHLKWNASRIQVGKLLGNPPIKNINVTYQFRLYYWPCILDSICVQWYFVVIIAQLFNLQVIHVSCLYRWPCILDPICVQWYFVVIIA